MRSWAFSASVLAHAGLAAALFHELRPRPRRAVAPVKIEVKVQATEPIPPPIAPPAPAPTPAPARTSTPTPPRRVRAIVSSSTPRPSPSAPEPAPTPAPNALRMRHAPPAMMRMPALIDPEAPPVPTLPPSVDLNAPITVPNVPGPHPARYALGRDVVPTADGSFTEQHPTFKAKVNRDGSVKFTDEPNIGIDSPLASGVGFGLAGHFDLTDAVMRAHGDDPYIYEKAKFLDRTREERYSMALADRHQRLDEALLRTPKVLAKVWAFQGWTPAERRQMIFKLWDEVAEEGAPEVLKTGVEVRATISTFIRKHLPWGTAAAYTPGELDALNEHRQSRARFDPYR